MTGFPRFDALLAHAEGLPYSYISEKMLTRWKEDAEESARLMDEFAANDLLPIVERNADRVLSESESDLIMPGGNSPTFSEFRLRPTASYYVNSATTLPEPRPKNSRGFHACGVDLSIGLYKLRYLGSPKEVPQIIMEFKVWGEYERRAFKNLYRDHKSLLGTLLKDAHLEFGTACCFDNVDSAKTEDQIALLGLYFENEDDENNFHFTRTFTVHSRRQDIEDTFLRCLLLFDAAMGYVGTERDVGRLVEHRVTIGALASRAQGKELV